MMSNKLQEKVSQKEEGYYHKKRNAKKWAEELQRRTSATLTTGSKLWRIWIGEQIHCPASLRWKYCKLCLSSSPPLNTLPCTPRGSRAGRMHNFFRCTFLTLDCGNAKYTLTNLFFQPSLTSNYENTAKSFRLVQSKSNPNGSVGLQWKPYVAFWLEDDRVWPLANLRHTVPVSLYHQSRSRLV